jgi:hypothetical protein
MNTESCIACPVSLLCETGMKLILVVCSECGGEFLILADGGPKSTRTLESHEFCRLPHDMEDAVFYCDRDECANSVNHKSAYDAAQRCECICVEEKEL